MNNEYWMCKQQEDGGMGAWVSTGGFFAGGPTVLRNANNDLVAFGRGADKKIWYKVFHASDDDGEWIALGGKLMSGRVSAIVDAQGLIHIYARGQDSAVWQKRQIASGTEAEWADWESLGGSVSGNVAAVLDAEGLVHLFARGIDGFMWGSVQALNDDGVLEFKHFSKVQDSVYLASAATVVARMNAQNLIEVIVRGGDKAFWHTRQTVSGEEGIKWSPWKSLGGVFSSAPTVQLNTDSLLTVYGKGPEKGVWYKQQAHHPVNSTSDSWSKWVALGGRFSAGVDAVVDNRSMINIFGRGMDKAIWSRTQVTLDGSVGYFGDWKSLGGNFRSFAC